MITVIVKFPLSPFQNRQAIAADFANLAEMYYDIPALVRKYFVIAEDGSSAGGIYLWETFEAAQAFHNENFKLMVKERYGAVPETLFFDCPIIVDNQFSYELQTCAA